MCYRKLYLRNPVKEEHRSDFDKTLLKVPCSGCPKCRSVKTNDWIVRSYFEFTYSDRKAFFVTLDFDKFNLPIYDIFEHEYVSYSSIGFDFDFKNQYRYFKCFNHKLVQDFLKRLRYHAGEFRFMCATDFGGFLKQPHYHLIVLTSSDISKADFFEAVKRCWHCGHYSNVEEIRSVSDDKIKAIKYVSGYVSKDLSFPDDKLTLKNLPSSARPRVFSSKNYGLSALMLSEIDKDSFRKGFVALPLGKNGKELKFSIPRYYELKLFYDYSWDCEKKVASLIRNQDGVELSRYRHNRHYVHLIKNIFSTRHSDVFSYIDRNSICDNLDVDMNHPFRYMSWYGIVCELFYDMDAFKEFLFSRYSLDYITNKRERERFNSYFKYFDYFPKECVPPRPSHSYYRVNLVFSDMFHGETLDYSLNSTSESVVYKPDWFNYLLGMCFFDLYVKHFSDVQCKIDEFNLVENAKSRSRYKLAIDLKFHRGRLNKYLSRAGFDFNSLKPSKLSFQNV